MFFHVKELQYHAKPERPDPVYARKLQEVLGGHFGEITVAMQYMFQGINCRADMKYRDLLLDTAAEELAHVEMLATMIARLLDGAPIADQEDMAKDPLIRDIMGGMNPQHVIVSGLGAMPADAVGNPWTAKYTISSGNLLADFRDNLSKESQGRLQVVRLYELASDPGIKDMLSFLIARDTMHQNQWIAAIAELEAREGVVVPATFPRELEKQQVSYTFYNFSAGEASRMGRWAHGPSMDGLGMFNYVAQPPAYGEKAYLHPAPLQVHDTIPAPGGPNMPLQGPLHPPMK
ncbi:manganese catalase family protein [Paenibacillus turpanensis]|uniref:manganese catalase family protein n=1 Tax=Paenibacillus turpanensis TaxID=2689078 RepID=UPI0014089CAF|nr:manganese catalase family protein [Paenibacillus turpanensis]